MKAKITDNLGLKILSVLSAVILWIVVNSLNDPSTTRTFYNIAVTLENTDLITGKGQVYEVLDNTNVIPRVSIRAPQSIISELSTQNIVATADVNELSSLDTISIRLDTNVYQDQINSITGSINTVKLSIEDKKSKTLSLNVEITGTPGDGYTAGEYSIDQNLVRISGAESVIDRISTAKAEVDVSGFTSDVRTNAEIKLYDADGNVITSDSITQNIKSVGVSVSILQTKTVPVNFNVSTEASAGYRGTGIVEADKSAVAISGRSSVLKGVESLDIPAEAISLSDHSENFTTIVDITPYLPDGVSLVNASDAIFTVTVYIEPEATKRIALSTDDISITNVPEGYTVSLSIDEGTILELVGLSAELAELTRDNVEAAVDIESFMEANAMEEPEEGFYSAEVSFALPDSVTVVDPVRATIHIVSE